MNEISWYHRIGTKLSASLLLFALLAVGLILALMVPAFNGLQQDATAQSAAGLERQGTQALLGLVRREVALRGVQLDQLSDIAHYGAELVGAELERPQITSASSGADLTLLPAGNRFDARPDRLSAVLAFKRSQLGASFDEHLRASAVLDQFAPQALERFSMLTEMSYVSPEGLTRLYPPLEWQTILPPAYPITREARYTVALPSVSQPHTTIWTPPYIGGPSADVQISASAPVYAGATFHGVVSIDVPLRSLVNDLGQIRPTDHGYAFLLDRQGKLIAAPPAALGDFFQASTSAMPTITETLGLPLIPAANAPLQQARSSMLAGETGVSKVTVKGNELFIAYAPLSSIDWVLVLVAPASEITSEAQVVATTIADDARATLQSILGLMLAGVVIGLIGTWIISRRLTNPVNQLVRGTRAIAAYDLNVSLPEDSRDELGLLARSFNQMTQQLHTAQRDLQAANQNLEQQVVERTSELEAERATLQTALAELQALSTTVARLTTPTIPVLPGVLVVPIIGGIDSARLGKIQHELLHAVAAQKAHTVIIDLTGLEALDASVALMLLESLESLRLLGARPVLVGVHPDVAQHLVQSSIDLSALETCSNLQEALQTVLQRMRRSSITG